VAEVKLIKLLVMASMSFEPLNLTDDDGELGAEILLSAG
jgi:hypothetical protein